jgi:hypothetical protein
LDFNAFVFSFFFALVLYLFFLAHMISSLDYFKLIENKMLDCCCVTALLCQSLSTVASRFNTFLLAFIGSSATDFSYWLAYRIPQWLSQQ